MITEPQNQPLLSLLIPTYNFSDGIDKILTLLNCEVSKNSLEIIISDDSDDNKVHDVVIKHMRKNDGIKYTRNIPQFGASTNWNSLLNSASGKYVLLFHHDEYPFNDNFLPDLITILKQDLYSVVILDCYLLENSGEIRRHVPNLLKNLLLKFPGYIFRRNYIGPPSAVVCRRDLYMNYDANLVWKIDVDLYYRIFKNFPKIFLSKIKIISCYKRQESITCSIRGTLSIIKNREFIYLFNKYRSNRMLRLLSSTRLWEKLLLSLEALVWLIFRSAQRILFLLKK